MDEDLQISDFIEKCTIREAELNLNYPPSKGIEGIRPRILPELNKRLKIYSVVKKLTIETDFLNQLPVEFRNFETVCEMNIQGSRWWNLTCENLPISTKKLVMWEQSNLNPSVMTGSERLINLQEIILDWETFFTFGDDSQYLDIQAITENVVPIARMGSLLTVTFQAGQSFWGDEMDDDWKERVISSPLFKEYSPTVVTQKKFLNHNVNGLDRCITVFLG